MDSLMPGVREVEHDSLEGRLIEVVLQLGSINVVSDLSASLPAGFDTLICLQSVSTHDRPTRRKRCFVLAVLKALAHTAWRN